MTSIPDDPGAQQLAGRMMTALDRAKRVPGPERVDPKSGDIVRDPVERTDGVLTADELQTMVPMPLQQQYVPSMPPLGAYVPHPDELAEWAKAASHAKPGTLTPDDLQAFLATLRPIERESLAVKLEHLEAAEAALAKRAIKPTEALGRQAILEEALQMSYRQPNPYLVPNPPSAGNLVREERLSLDACNGYIHAHNDLIQAIAKYAPKR